MAARPDLAAARNNLAALLERRPRADSAAIRAHYDAAAAAAPDDYDYAVNRAACARARGDGDASELFLRAAALDAAPYECHVALAEMSAARGRIDDALASAKRAVACGRDADDAAAARALLRALLALWRDTLDDADVVADAVEHGLEIGDES